MKRQGDFETPDAKRRRRGYSSATPADLSEVFGGPVNLEPRDMQLQPLDELEFSPDLPRALESLCEAWLTRSRTHGFWDSGSEAKRGHYVDEVLCRAVALVDSPDGLSLKVFNEYTFGNAHFSGPVEFVVVDIREVPNPILFVIEAKKDDFDQGKRQLAVQLAVAQGDNPRDDDRDIYGFVTNAVSWYPMRVNKFAEDPVVVGIPLMIIPSPNWTVVLSQLQEVVCRLIQLLGLSLASRARFRRELDEEEEEEDSESGEQ